MSSDTDSGGDAGIPDRSLENPFQEGTWMQELFEDVLTQERDVIIIVDDYRARRGTGKTVFSLQLADAMDQTPEGITEEKVSIQPEEVRNAYSSQPRGSGLVLDEAEVGASNRAAMSKTNQALREIMSMGRVEQKYVVVNAPVRGFIDKDIQKLADVWISMTNRGKGLVHHLKWMPYQQTLHTPKKQYLQVSDIETGTDLRGVYNYLTRKKQQRIKGQDGQEFIPLDEHKEEVQKKKKNARKESRDETIRAMMNHPEIQETDISQRMVGDAIGVSQQAISNILNSD